MKQKKKKKKKHLFHFLSGQSKASLLLIKKTFFLFNHIFPFLYSYLSWKNRKKIAFCIWNLYCKPFLDSAVLFFYSPLFLFSSILHQPSDNVFTLISFHQWKKKFFFLLDYRKKFFNRSVQHLTVNNCYNSLTSFGSL